MSLKVLFWTDTQMQLPEALHLLLSDQGHRIDHIRSVCSDLYLPVKSQLDKSHEQGFNIIISATPPIKINTTKITSFKDNRFKIFFLDDKICNIHHSQQAAFIILQWNNFINCCSSNPFGSRMIFPLKSTGHAWKRVEEVLKLPQIRK